jgi:autotransporter-associated beta strand protein
MKRIMNPRFLSLLLAAIVPQVAMSTVFFSDDFSSSTLNSATPAGPTATSTDYQIISAKSWTVTNISSGHLKFGIAATTSGAAEVQALFTDNPVTLSQVGDFVRMTVVFTNTIGILTGNGQFCFGMYNANQVQPVPGGMNATLGTGTDRATGYAQLWQGYVAQYGFTNAMDSRICTRSNQASGANNLVQDLVTSGSGSMSYSSPGAATIGSTTTRVVPALASNAAYTVVLTMKLISDSGYSVMITNTVYQGLDTNGTQIAQWGAIATNTTYMGNVFDGLAIGWRATANAAPWNIDILSIKVDGEVAPLPPPVILTQPVGVIVATNGACPFKVTAQGANMSYQWYRNGAALNDGGNITGAKSATLFITSAGTADEFSAANGYYCNISNPAGYTNSVTNSLTLKPATNLVWSGSSKYWDVNTTASWIDPSNNAIAFNYGDPVTFDDASGGNNTLGITLSDSYLTAASMTVDNPSYTYSFEGSGSFAGPGKLIYKGSQLLTINNANSYTGGTIISNASAYLLLNNLGGLGSGPITLAMAGGQMEVTAISSGSVNLNNDIVVADDFTILFDQTGAYAGSFGRSLSGIAGKTLTIVANNSGGSPTNNVRVRLYGNSTNDANLVLNHDLLEWAPYQSGFQVYNGLISGAGSLIQRAGGTTILNTTNTYSGRTSPTTGAIGLGVDSVGSVGSVTRGPIGTGPLNLTPEGSGTTGSGQLFAYGGARTIANAMLYGTNNLTLIVGGVNDLTFLAPLNLCGTNDPFGVPLTRTFQVTNTALTTFSGVISDDTNGVSAGYGLTKTGNGILVLNNTETYTGPTLVQGGTLRVSGSLAAQSAVTVTNATLGGNGTINGPVTIQANGILAPGASIGTLTLNSNLTLTGTGGLFFELDRGAVQSNDVCIVNGGLTNTGTGTVTVTNYGSTLVAGDKFYLFSKAMVGGGALRVIGAGAVWNNNLAADGSISVASATLTTPVFTNTVVSSGNIIMSGSSAPTYYSYYVLATTNIALPIASWTRVYTNSFTASDFSISIPIVSSIPNRYYRLNIP